ncbi:hypothetical protein Sjap_024188 [Stephania japonica]|uniref:Uncharacterized protein n=1 Tax=Stephania japonica TaxID=461633 RepID=A0AAP0ECY2_9MAGN
MESSSQLFGGTEECSSTESGWTMYIASPMHHDDDGGHSDGEGDYHADGDKDNDNDNDNGGGAAKYDYGHDGGGNDDDTDDSMASDASSGPCHDLMYFSNDDSKSKYSSCPYNKKKVMIRNMGTKRGVDEERKKSGLDKKGGSQPVVPNTSNINAATSTVPSSATKARKPKWMSKGN